MNPEWWGLCGADADADFERGSAGRRDTEGMRLGLEAPRRSWRVGDSVRRDDIVDFDRTSIGFLVFLHLPRRFLLFRRRFTTTSSFCVPCWS